MSDPTFHVHVFICEEYTWNDFVSDFRFWKPFNPLLGETFEHINQDVGYALIAEQVNYSNIYNRKMNSKLIFSSCS